MNAHEYFRRKAEHQRAVKYNSGNSACAEQRPADVLSPQQRINVDKHGYQQQEHTYAYGSQDNGVDVFGRHYLNGLFLKAEQSEHRVEQMLEAEHAAEQCAENH